MIRGRVGPSTERASLQRTGHHTEGSRSVASGRCPGASFLGYILGYFQRRHRPLLSSEGLKLEAPFEMWGLPGLAGCGVGCRWSGVRAQRDRDGLVERNPSPSLPLRFRGRRSQFPARASKILVQQLVPEAHMGIGADSIPFGPRGRRETKRGRRVPQTGQRHRDTLELEARLDPIPGLPGEFEALLIVPEAVVALLLDQCCVGEEVPAQVLAARILI